MNVRKAEFLNLVKTLEDMDEEVQLKIFNNWPTFKQMFCIMEHHPLAWTILKAAVNDLYHKSIAQSN